MIDIVVVADDLTGALDTGVQFIKKGILTLVITDLDFEVENIPKEIKALVIDTESRHLNGEQAKERVKNVLLKFKNHNIKYYYKKVDSTLRGNVGNELEGFIEGTGAKLISFVPAFPDNNRIVKNGILYVDGVEITKTSFAKDILNPIENDYIPNILNKNISCKIERVEEKDIENISLKDKKILLFDSENKGELINIGKKLKAKNLLKHSAGSAGFAEVIAEFEKHFQQNIKYTFEKNKILFMSGSVNPVSVEQTEYAKQNGYISYELDFKEIISKSFDFDKIINKINFNKDNKILIRTFSQKQNMGKNLNYLYEKELKIEDVTLNISKNIGLLTKNLIEKEDISAIIIFGGDTLMGVLQNLRCFCIIPLAEIISGVVLAEVEYNNRKIKIVTKAGGFGKNNIIKVIENYEGIR